MSRLTGEEAGSQLSGRDSKHTPGPWMAVSSRIRHYGRPPIFEDGLWDILPECAHLGRMPICTVDRGDDHDEETRIRAEDNARLIAAAPDLLEALVEARNEIAWSRFGEAARLGLDYHEFVKREWGGVDPKLAKMDSAIAKATRTTDKEPAK